MYQQSQKVLVHVMYVLTIKEQQGEQTMKILRKSTPEKQLIYEQKKHDRDISIKKKQTNNLPPPKKKKNRQYKLHKIEITTYVKLAYIYLE